MFRPNPWKKAIPGILVLLIFIAVTVYFAIVVYQDYTAAEFLSNFGTNMVAAFAGVTISAVIAIIIAIMIINPVEKQKREQRLKPLREPVLLFWDRHLTIYTIGVLQALECPQEIQNAISDITMEVTRKIDILADKEKLHKIQNWLRDITSGEELTARDLHLLKEQLDDLNYFIGRIRDTLVALPYLFEGATEIAYQLEMLSSNFLSGQKMLELDRAHPAQSEPTKLNSYKTAIIKQTACDAFSLIETIRRTGFKT